MSAPFVAEIRIVAFTFAPRGWAMCNGQILPLSQNTALFSLLGTTYGGDGKSNFALPNLQGSIPMQPDQGPGLSLHFLGETGGEQTVTLLDSEMPAHSHALQGAVTPAAVNAPGPTRSMTRPTGGFAYAPAAAPQAHMDPQALTVTGSSFPHNNMMPYLTLNFVIAMQGIYPPRW